jgi:hypothetical protein
MLLRGFVGAAAGFLAGVGFALTLDGFDQYCDLHPGQRGCGGGFILILPLMFACWMLVAAALIHAGFRLGHLTRGWQAAGIGSALWLPMAVVVVSIGGYLLEVHPNDGRLYALNSAVITSCVSYAIAALCIGRRRTA